MSPCRRGTLCRLVCLAHDRVFLPEERACEAVIELEFHRFAETDAKAAFVEAVDRYVVACGGDISPGRLSGKDRTKHFAIIERLAARVVASAQKRTTTTKEDTSR